MTERQFAVKFAKIVSEARKKKGMSQGALSLQSGLDRTYVSLIERGLRQPTVRILFKLAATLQLRPSRLIRLLEDEINFSPNVKK